MTEDRAAERRKVLELLQEGKITAEQAELLLQALEQRNPLRSAVERLAGRFPVEELKHIGNQVTQTVNQTLGELRRTIERPHWPAWDPFPLPLPLGHTVTVTRELNMPENVRELTIHTVNGRLQLAAWEEAFVRIHVRARVKNNRLLEARRILERALQVQEDGEARTLWVDHDAREGVASASIDVYVPAGLRRLFAKTNIGGIHADSLKIEDEFRLETDTGGIWLTGVDAGRIRLVADNGQLALHDSIGPRCSHAYLQTQSGKIVVQGIAPSLQVQGTARTSLGKVDVQGDGWRLEPGDGKSAMVHFERQPLTEAAATLARLHCETRAGSVLVRG
jgi:hypothetical protein